MPELFHGSSYSSGWKPLDRSNENNELIQSASEAKLKQLAAELDKTKTEYEEKLTNTKIEADAIQTELESKLSQLTQALNEKDEEIRKLVEEKEKNAIAYLELDNKYNQLLEQFIESESKGFFEPLLKKITNKKITPK